MLRPASNYTDVIKIKYTTGRNWRPKSNTFLQRLPNVDGNFVCVMTSIRKAPRCGGRRSHCPKASKVRARSSIYSVQSQRTIDRLHFNPGAVKKKQSNTETEHARTRALSLAPISPPTHTPPIYPPFEPNMHESTPSYCRRPWRVLSTTGVSLINFPPKP